MKKLLIVAFACLVAVQLAGAQSQPSSTAKNSRDASSGHASGKQAPNPTMTGRESSAPSVSEVVVTKPSKDRESSTPSVSEGTVKAPTGQTRVAAGDVNGDGRADVAATGSAAGGNGQNAAINTSHSNIKSRDLATGQASGKRQHAPVTIQKVVDASTPK